MLGALKNLFTRPAEGKGAARRVLNVGGGSKGVALPPHFQDWEQLLLDIDPRVGADLVCEMSGHPTALAQAFRRIRSRGYPDGRSSTTCAGVSWPRR